MNFVETSLFGIRLHATDPATAVQSILARAGQNPGVVCVANVDMVTRAVSDPKLARLMRNAVAVVTDGMPLVWALRRCGQSAARRVYGPGLVRELCGGAALASLPIYLYGGTPEEVDGMAAALLYEHPKLRIVGRESPPLLPQDPPLDTAIVDRINASGARLVFVGLGCPKQEYWMSNHTAQINAVLLGVGLAFAQIAGTKAQAPKWMGDNGLEWLFRLMQEPRRLARRYIVGNSKFILLLAREQWRSWVRPLRSG